MTGLERAPLIGNYARHVGESGVRHGLPYAVHEDLYRLLPDDDGGTNVFERDWDVLVVLDACRAGWFETVAPEFELFGSVGRIRSVGARTAGWARRTFDAVSAVDRPVTYVHGAKYGRFASDVADIERVFVRSRQFRYPPAHQISRVALDRWEGPAERLVVHYAQPHFPVFRRRGSRTDVEVVGGTGRGAKVALLRYRGDYNAVESLYRANLRYVLGEVAALVTDLGEARVALTADHGEFVGEYGLVGHFPGVQHDAVRLVPWARVGGETGSTVS